MRIAIVSDIHGNLAALDAVGGELQALRPDLIVQGGDLALNGPRPRECVDRVREYGWPGVVGNTDQVLWDQTQIFESLRATFEPRIAATQELLGADHVAWLRGLPEQWRRQEEVALVHASPGDLWRAELPDADEEALQRTYGSLGAALAVYGHIHRPYVRVMAGLTVANSGSVGMPFDGDPRASYLLIEDGSATVRRVDYDVERQVHDLLASGYPDADLLADSNRTGRMVRRGG